MFCTLKGGFLTFAVAWMLVALPVSQASADRGERNRAPRIQSDHPQRFSSAPAYRRHVHPLPGHRVRTLPPAYRSLRVGRQHYRYFDGVFYRPARDGAYVVVTAPIGARVGYLPPGYISFFIGPRRYFYANFTYYLWDNPSREYVVIEEPQGATRAVVAASEAGAGELYVYPRLGQNEEQRDRDRYECYLWAVQQAGYDPATPDSNPEKATDYRRANSACLEGRGYTVK